MKTLALALALVAVLSCNGHDCRLADGSYRLDPRNPVRVVAICKDGFEWQADITKPLHGTCKGHYGVGFLTGASQ